MSMYPMGDMGPAVVDELLGGVVGVAGCGLGGAWYGCGSM